APKPWDTTARSPWLRGACHVEWVFGFGGTDLLRALRDSISRLLTWYGASRSLSYGPARTGDALSGSCPFRPSKGLSSGTSVRDEATRVTDRSGPQTRTERYRASCAPGSTHPPKPCVINW